MYCILSESSDPFYNLAVEEYLLRNFSEDIFMLYVNDSSIIVGKHQNAISEINLKYIFKNNIKVARRLTGGGTVYHDKGNLNFCFISTVEGNNKVDFRKYTQPILEVLWDLGINASSGGRNDLIANGFKISGNAEHIFKNRVLHHGTLLFESDLNVLSNAIKVNLSRFYDKSVQSVRSNVINIKELLEKPIGFVDFRNIIFNKVLNLNDSEVYTFTDLDREKIDELKSNKFSTWEWVYGYSPKYKYSNTLKIHNGDLKISLSVEKGIIKEAEILINGVRDNFFDVMCNGLIGERHFPDDISWIRENNISHPDIYITGEDIYSILF